MNDTGDTSASGEVANENASDLSSGQALEKQAPASVAEVAVNSAVFPALGERVATDAGIPLDRFYDVTVRVWAELGQVTLPIGELLQLGEGAVMKLSRPVSDPIDLMAQGVRFAKGEVVVVDDCFAIRITEIDSDRVTAG